MPNFKSIRSTTNLTRDWARWCFPALALVACFAAVGAGCMFSRAWRRSHVFPHLASVACFPTLGACCMFSRALRRLHVFPLGTGCMFFPAWRRLHGLQFEFWLFHCVKYLLPWLARLIWTSNSHARSLPTLLLAGRVLLNLSTYFIEAAL